MPKSSKRGFQLKAINGKTKIITDEDLVHIQVVEWLQFRFPWALFHSDAAGELMTDSMRIRQSKVNPKEMSFPDLQILEARRGYFGLFIELKREEEELFAASGLFKNNHLTRQNHTLNLLKKRRFHAEFAKGFEAAIKIIDWYLSGPQTSIER